MTDVKTTTAAEATPTAASSLPPPQAEGSNPPAKATPPTSIDLEQAKPEDFDGKLATNDSIPSEATLAKVADYPLLDKHGKSHTFKSLYNSRNGARRVLVIFIRHFFCGQCQEYIRTLAESVSNEALLGLPITTSIVVIGCGSPDLIDTYVDTTGCPYPLYTDPQGTLFTELGMVKTLALGERPAYIRSGFLGVFLRSVGQALKQVPHGLGFKSGDQRQVGGEFLFEPLDLVTPVATPNEGGQGGAGAIMDAFGPHATAQADEDAQQQPLEEKKVTWCHRMRTTRDHAEIPEIMELLGLDGHGQPIKDAVRWERTIRTRKGTGLSMASRMMSSRRRRRRCET